jgi:uncharacterized protein YecE (DUF72 family)
MQPRDGSWDAWRKTAPEGFRFAVKVHRYITHLKRLNDCEASLERGIQSARRLGPHLGPLLFQLPPNFKRTAANAGRLNAFLEQLPRDIEAAFELRDKSWFVDETFQTLKRHRVALCAFDSPKLKSPLLTTASFAYMRFHASGAPRGGNYSNAMLSRWADGLRRLASGVDEVYVYFNNDAFGHAVRNAITLTEMLGADAVRPERAVSDAVA